MSSQAFSAGQYAIEDGENVVSFVYTTFSNKLFLYHNIHLPQLQTTNFLVEAEKNQQIARLLADLGAETREVCLVARYLAAARCKRVF